MTLTTAQIATTTRLLHACRDDWDLAGIAPHVEKLAADPRPWPELLHQAVEAAAEVTNRTPATIVRPTTQRTFTPRGPAPAPTCEIHPTTGTRADGRCAGCWLDAQPDVPYTPRLRHPARSDADRARTYAIAHGQSEHRSTGTEAP